MDKWNLIKNFLLEHKKKFILVFSGVVFLTLLIVGSFYLYKSKESQTIVYESVLEEKKEIEDKKEEIYYIDIKGSVYNPGVYSIEKGKRVVDAINQAGGLTENANTSLLNLSMLVCDQMVIVVYSNEEINALEETIKKQQTKESLCKETVSNDACITTNKSVVVPRLPSMETSNTKMDVSSEKININTASKEILMTLSKIGESKANSIIEYREKNGEFKTIEDIKKVSGIGDSLFESIKDYITI